MVASVISPMTDRVFELEDGWYCVIAGRMFGTGRTREEAERAMLARQVAADVIADNALAERLVPRKVPA